MNTEERLVSYQVNECLKQRDELREQLALEEQQHKNEAQRLRAELEQERQTSGTLYKDWLKAQAELERLRAMPTLTPEEAKHLLDCQWGIKPDDCTICRGISAKLSLIANGENEGERCPTCGLQDPGPEHRANEPLLCSDEPRNR